ncbi:hypothetical protein DFH07DRAFT_811625 [Mycena maculata]|uniref:ATPase domain-containing protein n=1 Tax=Mycena maculata TaxID=230809 RepID=A0AAD7JKP3_9AGAR|nr:hypothetical protein DFH07DRAFT_811625 [Mycena maculata]
MFQATACWGARAGSTSIVGNVRSSSWRSHVPAIGKADSTMRTRGCNYITRRRYMQSHPTKLRKAQPHSRTQHSIPIHWFFRSNIPRRRTSFLPVDMQKRNFFGLGEIVGVLTNPAETVRSLTESKRLLDEARREISENKERSQLRVKHTFSRYPGFFPRRAETRILEQVLEGEPSFTVLFGASSVGKTALLREVLCSKSYHVLHFDLRIAGFADLASLYMSLSQQMEQYFEEIGKEIGYEEFEREAWGFKHDRINVEKRMAEARPGSEVRDVKTSDVARLMELFQSSLLRYREFQPANEDGSDVNSSRQHLPPSSNTDNSKRKRFFAQKDKGKRKAVESTEKESPEKKTAPKKIPVIFFDEAHRLPALIQSTETMKCLLDSMLVLTKQDRLCHVIHATSDPFYQTWLRQLNVMQHCKIITVGDCSKAETRGFFNERILPRVPHRLRNRLNFEQLYDAFGGKLAHWHDYCTDYINSNGNLEIKQSSHFLQAHALLNLHIIHSSQSAAPRAQDNQDPRVVSNPDTIHPGIGPAGFKIYSPITNPHGPFPEDRATAMTAGHYSADFSAMELLKVMGRLAQREIPHLPYFPLCRELGVRAVDGMVKGRVLDLRWTEPVTNEYGDESELDAHLRATSSGTAVDQEGNSESSSQDGDMVPVSERELAREEYSEVVGCKLVPTPIMKFAMREVVEEYEDKQSISEYASLSDVGEY